MGRTRPGAGRARKPFFFFSTETIQPMTSQDFIRTEAANTDRIILYREGLFWKAYERSAFAVCRR